MASIFGATVEFEQIDSAQKYKRLLVLTLTKDALTMISGIDRG